MVIIGKSQVSQTNVVLSGTRLRHCDKVGRVFKIFHKILDFRLIFAFEAVWVSNGLLVWSILTLVVVLACGITILVFQA